MYHGRRSKSKFVGLGSPSLRNPMNEEQVSFETEQLQKKELALILEEAKKKEILNENGQVEKQQLRSLLYHKLLKTLQRDNLGELLKKFNLLLPNQKGSSCYIIDIKKLSNGALEPKKFMVIEYNGTHSSVRADDPSNSYEKEKRCFLCDVQYDSREKICNHLINKHTTSTPKAESSLFRLDFIIPPSYLNVKVEIKNVTNEMIAVTDIQLMDPSGISEKYSHCKSIAENDKFRIVINHKYFKEPNKCFYLMIFAEKSSKKFVEFYKITVNNTLADAIHQERNQRENSLLKSLYSRKTIPYRQTYELDSYLPDEDLFQIFSEDFHLKSLGQNLSEKELKWYKLIIEFKRSHLQLDETNYTDILKFLVEIDDFYCNHTLMKIVIPPVKVQVDKKQYFFVLPGTCSYSEVLEEGDLVVLKPTYCIEAVETVYPISKISNNHVYFDPEDLFAPDTYHIKFRKDRTTAQMEQKALHDIKQDVIETVLLPKNFSDDLQVAQNRFDFEWVNPSIKSNREQQQAVKNIVNGTSYPAPYVIFGPPGTGKTSTIVETITQIYKLKPTAKILVTASSNYACDEIAMRLLNYISPMNLYRFYSRSGKRRLDDLDTDLKCISNFAKGKFTYPALEILKMYRIILSTVTNSGKLAMMGFEKNYFEFILLDECGSSTEPSSIIPISGLVSVGTEKKTNIVIAGDPKQLGPVLKCDFVSNMGLGTSLLERLMNRDFYKLNADGKYNEKVITKLLQNFRYHQGILKIPNELFYDGELIPKAGARITDFALKWKSLPNKNLPVIFHAVEGETKSHFKSASLYNEEEINQVFAYLQEIIIHGINGQKILMDDIGIVSPYKLQVQKIKWQLKQSGCKGIEVGSAEQFQGKEKKVIILSTVRSNTKTAGFLGNEKRLNVVITRAKGLLIIIGNPKTLQMNLNWYKLLEYCKTNNAVQGDDFELIMPVALNVDSDGIPVESYEAKFLNSLTKIEKQFLNKYEM